MENEQFNFYGSGENIVKMENYMYKLIIEQLLYNSHQTIAENLSYRIATDVPFSPSNRLFNLLISGLKYEAEHFQKNDGTKAEKYDSLRHGLDFEYEAGTDENAPAPNQYVATYVANHKAPCRASAFSKNGKLIATGSVDASIKILHIEKMVAKADEQERSQRRETHPVITTLYHHTNEVTCLLFHPTRPVILSGSKDTSIKLYDFGSSCATTLQDALPITCMSLHTNGYSLLVGTTNFAIRLFDINTAQGYVGRFLEHCHSKEITSVNYQQNGKMFVTSSKDGHIKLWDGLNNRCIQTYVNAHDGAEVCSVEFSKNGKYVLSSGKDSMVKLWELSRNRCLMGYTGAGTNGAKEYNAQAVFNHTEDFVLFPDEKATALSSWNSRKPIHLSPLPLGHMGPVRYIVHSSVSPAFVTCSDDHRAKFWMYGRLY